MHKVHGTLQNQSEKISKEQENITYTQGKRRSMKTSPKMDQMLELAEKNFKSSIITILMDVKDKYAFNK